LVDIPAIRQHQHQGKVCIQACDVERTVAGASALGISRDKLYGDIRVWRINSSRGRARLITANALISCMKQLEAEAARPRNAGRQRW